MRIPKIPDSLECTLPLILLAALCANAWLLKLPDLHWGIAMSGWSPLDWVAHLRHPQDFTRDFGNGIHVYDKSSFMYIYPLASQWFGISPEQIMPAAILFEIGFLAACAAYFCRAIAPQSPMLAACAFALMLVASSARDMELANFGGTFFWGLYYNVADGLRLLGIALFLKRRVVAAGLLFAASVTVHPIMAMMGGLFVFGCLLAERRIAAPRRLVLAAVLFGALVAAWAMLKFRDANVASSAIDAHTWIAMAKAFSFHFFPVDYGNLTLYHDTHVVPLLSLSALAAFYLPRVCPDPLRCRAILCGLALLVVLAAAGLLISVYVPVPALIKLALPRASDMLILVLLAIGAAGLVSDILNGPVWYRVAAAAVLLSPFVMKPGFAPLPVLLLVAPRLRASFESKWPPEIRWTPLVLCGALVLLAAGYWAAGIAHASQINAYTGDESFWGIAFGAAALALAIAAIRYFAGSQFDERGWLTIALMLALAWYASAWINRSVPIPSDRKRGHQYLAVQRWAKENTPTTALFMVDPTIYYGWRDFSERSSFGNLREWLHTSWLYDSRLAQYLEGKRRFDEFGIGIQPYLGQHPSINGFYKLDADMKKRFYELDPQWFAGMGRRYGIDYIVLSRDLLQKNYPFQMVFRNDGFVVYKLPENPAGQAPRGAGSR